MPSVFNKSRSFWISSLSSRMSLAFASSLTTALQTICLALSAYLKSMAHFFSYFQLHKKYPFFQLSPQCAQSFVVINVCRTNCGNHRRFRVATEIFAQEPSEHRVAVRNEFSFFRLFATQCGLYGKRRKMCVIKNIFTSSPKWACCAPKNSPAQRAPIWLFQVSSMIYWYLRLPWGVCPSLRCCRLVHCPPSQPG